MEVDKQSTLNAKIKECRQYVCISCLEPTSILYRQFSTVNTIKLHSCASCQADVDPYIERQLLLVVMDILLLRPPAYRHLIFNRQGISQNGSVGWLWGSQWDETWRVKNGCVTILPGVLFAVCLLAQMKFESLRCQENIIMSMGGDSNMNSESKCFSYSLLESDTTVDFPMLLLLLHSSLEYFSLWFATSFMSHIMLGRILRSSNKSEEPKEGTEMNQTDTDDGNKYDERTAALLLRRELFKATHIPHLFHIITLLVHIYEHSPTVRLLGRGLITIYHWYFVSCVLERTVRYKISIESKVLDKESNWFWVLIYRLIPGFPLVVGFAFQWCILEVLGVNIEAHMAVVN